MKSLSLSGFKKLKEDKQTVTMGHPTGGHSITILKSKISALQKKQLEQLPIHLADGGMSSMSDADGGSASPASDETPTPEVQQAYAREEALRRVEGGAPLSDEDRQKISQDTMASVEMNKDKTDSTQQSIFNDTNAARAQAGMQPLAAVSDAPGVPAPASLPSVVTNDPSVAPAQSPSPAAGAPGSNSGFDTKGAYDQGQRAITEQQDVATQLAKKQADIQQQDLDSRKVLQANVEQNAKEFQDHQKQLINDYQNGHIDPKHFQENMSTGQKVATAIGLIVGGFTGGFNGTGVNPAQEWLDKQIGRDIDAQKAKLDQQKTLFGANQDLYHDQTLANNATRMNMNDIYDHKIQLAAAQLGTPQAKASADAQHAKFALENAQLLQQNAIRSSALQAIKRGGAGLDPLTLGQAGFMKPEEAQKEQAAFDAQKAGVTRINDLYSQANKEQTTGNLMNPQSYKRIDAINSGIRDAILATDVAHRLSPEVMKSMLDPNLIKTTDTEETRALKQNDILQKLQAHGSGDMPITSRYAPQSLPQYSVFSNDQKAIVWAKRNPRDPRSQEILNGR